MPWEACQRGLWYLAKHTSEDTKQAQHFFRQACELDTLLATPHALFAECHLQMLGLGGSARADQEMAEEKFGKQSRSILATAQRSPHYLPYRSITMMITRLR